MADKVGAIGYKLYVGNLPWTIGSKQFRQYFAQFGHILHARVMFDKNTGMSKGFGFVTFLNEKSVGLTQNKTDHMLEGNTLKINTVKNYKTDH